MLVLPSLAPVRYPRPTAGEGEGEGEGASTGIDLDGESDDDDEYLHALMRARLAMQDSEQASTARPEQPPQVRSLR